MFSKILVKLVDQAIVPAILLLVTRVGSVLVLTRYFQVPYTIDASGFVFTDQAAYAQINSYSLFLMIIVLTLGLGYVLLKSLAFHDSHIKPHVAARLFTLRLSSFMQTSLDLYSQGAVWVSYLYLLLVVAGVMGLFGLVYAWVFYVALIVTIGSTILFVLDIENELEYAKEHGEEELIENVEQIEPYT